jgi:hypothetical protein
MVSRQPSAPSTSSASGPDFAAPTAVLKAGSVWERADVEAWVKRTGRALAE